MSNNGKIFISYAHSDQEYLKDLKKYIHPLLQFRHADFETWDDTTLITGQKLFDKIHLELDKFSLMICLISPDYLASRACLDELNIALSRNEQGNIEQLNIFPIIVRECGWKFTSLADFLLQPKDAVPISTLVQRGESKDKIYNDIATELEKTLSEIKKLSKETDGQKKNLVLSKNSRDNFEHFIDDLGLEVKHPHKSILSLSDIYIYPDIRDPNNDDTIKKSTSTVAEVLDKYKLICFTGSEEIGKTSLSKKISQDIKSSGRDVILLKGNEVKNPKLTWIKDKFNKKFGLYKDYVLSNTVLIIDDFTKQSLRNEDFNKLLEGMCSQFDQVILFADKNEIVQCQAKLANKDFYFLDILPFGYVKRNDFIKRWLTIGKDDDERLLIDNNILAKTDQIASQFDTIMKKNIMDSRPIYLITIIQILDNFSSRSDKFTFTSFGYCYQALITGMLSKAKVNLQQDLDGIFNFLSHLAFKFYSVETKKIFNNEFNEFLKDYESKFNPLKNIKEILITSGILYTPDNDVLKFSQNYLYYFCCAKFIADNFSKHSSEISHLCENIHNEEKANILIFLVHHFRDDNILLNEVLTHSVCLLDNYKTFDMTLEETNYYKDLVGDKIKQIIWEEKDIENERLKSLKQQDLIKNPDSILEQASASSHEEVKDVIEFKEIQDIVSAIRSLEVIGQIAKNRNSSIELKGLEEIIETSYDIGLRILSFYMNLFNMTFNDMRDLLEELKTNEGKTNAKEEAETMIRNFCFNVCLHVIKLIAQFTAHPRLLNTSELLAKRKGTPAYNLILLASQLNVSYEIPKDLIREIADVNNKNILVYSLLKNVVRNHAYLYDLDYKDKQWVQANLDIKVKEQLLASRDKGLRMINP